MAAALGRLPGGTAPARFFVGGLAHDATAEEVRRLLAPMGDVSAVSVVPPKRARPIDGPAGNAPPGATCRGFAFVDVLVRDERAVRRVTAAFEGSRARGGGRLRIRPAQPSRTFVDDDDDAGAPATAKKARTVVVMGGAHFERTVANTGSIDLVDKPPA